MIFISNEDESFIQRILYIYIFIISSIKNKQQLKGHGRDFWLKFIFMFQ